MATITNPFEPINNRLDEIQAQQEQLIKAVAITHQTVQPSNDLMTVDEVCTLLKLSRSRVYSLRSEGKIPCLRNGLFDRTEVMNWLKPKPKQPKKEVSGAAFRKITN